MNNLSGTIIHVESSKAIALVDVQVHDDIFSAIVLDTLGNGSYLKKGSAVTLLFKETEVSIGKNLSGLISLRNRIAARVKNIERSEILSKVILDYQGNEIVSIITTRSVDRLDLKPGEPVEWLVKANEMTLQYETVEK